MKSQQVTAFAFMATKPCGQTDNPLGNVAIFLSAGEEKTIRLQQEDGQSSPSALSPGTAVDPNVMAAMLMQQQIPDPANASPVFPLNLQLPEAVGQTPVSPGEAVVPVAVPGIQTQPGSLSANRVPPVGPSLPALPPDVSAVDGDDVPGASATKQTSAPETIVPGAGLAGFRAAAVAVAASPAGGVKKTAVAPENQTEAPVSVPLPLPMAKKPAAAVDAPASRAGKGEPKKPSLPAGAMAPMAADAAEDASALQRADGDRVPTAPPAGTHTLAELQKLAGSPLLGQSAAGAGPEGPAEGGARVTAVDMGGVGFHTGPAASAEGNGLNGVATAAATSGKIDSSPAQQVIDSLRVADTGSGKQIVLHLDPPHLGKVRMTMHSDLAGVVRCVLKVDNPGTLDHLRAEAPAMLTRLADSGVQVKRLEISLSPPAAPTATPSQSDSSFAAPRQWDSASYSAFRDSQGGRQDQAGAGADGGREHPADGSSGRPGSPRPAGNDPAFLAQGYTGDGINVWI